MEESINLFVEYKPFFIIVHIFSVIIGMGSAIVSDILFNIFIKDKKINPTENKTLSYLSKIIWIALYFIILSGIAIFFSDTQKYINSPKFLLKIFIVCCIILNGYLFQRFIHPALRKINFHDTNHHHKYVRIRKISFALGSISFISWIFAFILGSIASIPVSFFTGMYIYISIILIGIIASQIIEYKITH